MRTLLTSWPQVLAEDEGGKAACRGAAACAIYDTVSDFSRSIVVHVAKTVPSRFVAKSGGSNRVGKIFVDYLRNGHGATTAAAFSARARPGLGVSIPIHWEQLSAIDGGAHWTISTAPTFLAAQEMDPWSGYWKSRQPLTKAMKMLDL